MPRDYYPTPLAAVEPLIDHLPYTFDYIEPCAGDGRLIKHIDELTNEAGKCRFASDIEPRDHAIYKLDALRINFDSPPPMDFCITNPPWERKFLHEFIWKWLAICPTWLLFDADWMHTKQSSALMTHCTKIVSVGRVKWIEGSKNTGKDNCCWYLFDKTDEQTQFFGRNDYEDQG